MCEWFETCHPCPQKKFRGHHKHQALGYHMSRELPGDQGLGASGAPQGVLAGKGPPRCPSQGEGQAGNGSQGQARIPSVKAHSDEAGLGLHHKVSPWVRAGVSINKVHGQAQAWLQCNPTRTKCESHSWNAAPEKRRGWVGTVSGFF